MFSRGGHLSFSSRLAVIVAAVIGFQLSTPSPGTLAFQIVSDVTLGKMGKKSIAAPLLSSDRKQGVLCTGIANQTSVPTPTSGMVALASQQYGECIRNRINENLVCRLVRGLGESSVEERKPKRFRVVSIQSVKSGDDFLWPVLGSISSGFGIRRHPITHRRSFHGAIDIRSLPGTPVSAPAAGVVIEAERDGAMGRVVRIRTANQTVLTFGHLSGYRCVSGQYVRRGQIIGLVGSSGRATGPHLHFAVQVHGRYMNPLTFLSRF